MVVASQAHASCRFRSGHTRHRSMPSIDGQRAGKTLTARTGKGSARHRAKGFRGISAAMHAQEMLLTPPHRRVYRYFDLVMAAFVAVYLCSNLIGPAKAAQLTLTAAGSGDLRRRRAVLPDLLHLRRHPHRGIRLRPGAAGDLGRIRGMAFASADGLGRRAVAAGAGVAATRRPTRSLSARPGGSCLPR
jgi:hypothetical protein